MRSQVIALLVAGFIGGEAWAANINKKLIAEFDPVAPASSSYEQQFHEITTNKWGANVDFNVGGVLSTGPEFWSGAFLTKGQDDGEIRREDLYPGERHKVNATRLRWNITFWGIPSSMRGWYIRTGYSWLRVDSRANRFTEQSSGEGDAIPSGVFYNNPDDETDLVTDERHGGYLGFGQRWLVWNDSMSITVGVSATSNFRRSITVDSDDPMARADYDQIIEDLPETRMTTRPTPEMNLSLGYAW